MWDPFTFFSMSYSFVDHGRLCCPFGHTPLQPPFLHPPSHPSAPCLTIPPALVISSLPPTPSLPFHCNNNLLQVTLPPSTLPPLPVTSPSSTNLATPLPCLPYPAESLLLALTHHPAAAPNTRRRVAPVTLPPLAAAADRGVLVTGLG